MVNEPGKNNDKFYWFELFKRAFLNYFWIGILLCLTSIIIEQYYDPPDFKTLVLINLLSAIGISIIVASIFTFATDTSSFINRIKDFLEEIVIKRTFLGNIDTQSKEIALKSLLSPSEKEKDIYSNIEGYYEYYIKQTLNIGQKCVRSNYTFTTKAFYDNASMRVVFETIVTYRLYPSIDGYRDINVSFGSEGNLCEYVMINKPDGSRTVFSSDNISFITEKDIQIGTIKLSELGDGFPRLDIEIKAIEYGFDHWGMAVFQALQPTDGFRYSLTCDDSLTIKQHSVFLAGATYHLDIKQDLKCISLYCNQWINEGSGISVIVSITKL